MNKQGKTSPVLSFVVKRMLKRTWMQLITQKQENHYVKNNKDLFHGTEKYLKEVL